MFKECLNNRIIFEKNNLHNIEYFPGGWAQLELDLTSPPPKKTKHFIFSAVWQVKLTL